MAERPSLKSVALAAAVSPSTVSNAYNRPEQLSAQLRQRIFEIAAQQGYAGPDPAARSLRSGHTGAIGVLFTQQLSYAFSDPYCAELLSGIAEVAETSGTGMLLMPVAAFDPASASVVADGDEARRSVESVARAVVDGVVADGIDDRHPALRVLADRGVPLVRSAEGAPDPALRVIIDEFAAARSVGELLRELGHRSVAVLVDTVGRVNDDEADGAFDESRLFPYTRPRLAGLREGLGADLTVVAAGPNYRESGRRAAAVALDGKGPHGPVTAIAAVTDVLALGALDELAARGLRPGRDVSVTGFDDVPAAAAAGLTTIRQPIREKGRVMARMLLDDSFTQRHVRLGTQLIPRGSTARVGASA